MWRTKGTCTTKQCQIHTYGLRSHPTEHQYLYIFLFQRDQLQIVIPLNKFMATTYVGYQFQAARNYNMHSIAQWQRQRSILLCGFSVNVLRHILSAELDPHMHGAGLLDGCRSLVHSIVRWFSDNKRTPTHIVRPTISHNATSFSVAFMFVYFADGHDDQGTAIHIITCRVSVVVPVCAAKCHKCYPARNLLTDDKFYCLNSPV